jgi:CHAT domain-containing protein/tetratricopeptide (TPR) repeat protein
MKRLGIIILWLTLVLGIQAQENKDSLLRMAENLTNIVSSAYEQGDYQKVVDKQNQTMAIYEKLGLTDNREYGFLLNTFALSLSQLNENQKAVELGTKVLKITESIKGKNSKEYITSLNNLATYYCGLGAYMKAFELGKQSFMIGESVLGKNNANSAFTLNNLASYCSKMGLYHEAIKMEVAALRIEELSVGTKNLDYITMIGNLAGYFDNIGSYKEAISLGTSIIKIRELLGGKNNADYAIALSSLATYYSDSCDYAKAVELSAEAFNIVKSVLGKNHPLYVYTLGNLSAYLIEKGDYIIGVDSLISYNHIMESTLRDNFQTMTNAERAYFWNNYETLFTIYMPCMDYKVRSEKSEGLCYNSLLLSKGLLLTTGMEMKKLIQESGDTSAINKYEILQQTRSVLRKLYELPISERSINVDSLETTAQQIEKELVRGSKQYGDFTRNMLLEWQDVQKVLKKEDVAIEFVNFPIAKDSIEYAAMVLRKGMKCPKMIDLCPQSDLLKNQKNGTNMYYGYENKATYNLIWKKLELYLHEGSDVYFSPSGLLYQMNIEALKDSAGRMANEKYNMFRVSTTKELCYKGETSKIKNATLYGGLTYDMDSTAMCNESRKYHSDDKGYLAYRGYLPDSISRGAWSDLPQTGKEVDMIARELNDVAVRTEVVKGIEGTEESFKSLSGKNISVIHLATHGFFLKDEEAPSKKYFQNMMQDKGTYQQADTSMKRSGLIFSGGQKAWLGGTVPDNVEDGILLAEEIPTIDLRGTDLLVLSACDTGLGEVNSEGVFGLQRGFKQAGVKTIVMSLWQVSDNATLFFMSQFYKNLADGQTKQQAFISAQKSLRESTDFSDPKYWAAFIMLDAI